MERGPRARQFGPWSLISNTDHLITVQYSTGKPCIPTYMWKSSDTNNPKINISVVLIQSKIKVSLGRRLEFRNME